MRRRVRVARTRKEEARERRTYAKPTVAACNASGFDTPQTLVLRVARTRKEEGFATTPREDTAPVTCCGVG